MRAERRSPPQRRTGNGLEEIMGKRSSANNTTPAPVRAFRQELWVIMNAAHRMAAGNGLAWPDYDRLHQAHQHVLKVLEAVNE